MQPTFHQSLESQPSSSMSVIMQILYPDYKVLSHTHVGDTNSWMNGSSSGAPKFHHAASSDEVTLIV